MHGLLKIRVVLEKHLGGFKGQVIAYARIGIESTVAVLMKGKPQKRPAFF